MFINIIFLSMFILLFINIRYILIIFKVSEVFVDNISMFAKKLILPKIIDNFANFMKGLLIA